MLKLMKLSLIPVATLVLLTGCSNGENKEVSTLSVTGTETLEVAPDLAYLTVNITSESTASKEALDNATNSVNSVKQALKLFKIGEDNIETTRFSSNGIRDYNIMPVDVAMDKMESSLPNPVVGTSVNTILEVEVERLVSVSGILTELANIPGVEVSNISYSLKDRDEAVEKVRNAAIAKAKSKATASAKELGITILDVHKVSIEDSNNDGFYAAEAKSTMALADRSMMNLSISPTKISLNATANIEFEIK